MSPRRRADQALVERGLAESRAKAQRHIMAGEVWLGTDRVAKPSQLLTPEQIDALELKRRGKGYVGRGAEKIAPVLDAAGWEVAGAICLDVGASTGGFTEVLLERGAKRVWAVDVGYGQLHPRLRDDGRVEVRERSNFRHWDAAADPQRFAFAVMDVSFISSTLLLPPLAAVLEPGGRALIMVKPQFELGKDQVPRGGVVRDPERIAEAVDRVATAAAALGLVERGRHPAGVAGRRGNREVFLELERP